MNNQIRISAKNLGELALPTCCDRCIQLKLRLQHRLPFQIFPGIFSSIDAYTKRVVESAFAARGGPPAWLEPLGDITGYRKPPHFSKFNITIPEYGVLLTGTPDAVFSRRDGSHVIADYKTARYTGTQDELFPMYETQLNVYALIGEERGFAPVSGLGLIYFEPITDDGAAADGTKHRGDGFSLGFSARVHPVSIEPSRVTPLVARVRTLYDMRGPAPGQPNCEDCTKLAALLEVVRT